jgi:glucose-1-phosphate thymidylyltransferase
VANRPIAHHVLDRLRSAGVTEVVVVSSTELRQELRDCLADYAARERVELTLVDVPPPVDLVSALGLGTPLIGDAPCVVHPASGLVAEPLTPMIERLRQDPSGVVALVHQDSDPVMPLGAVTRRPLQNGAVHLARAGLGLTGVLLLGAGLLGRVAAELTSAVEIDLAAVADRVALMGSGFQVVTVSGWRRYAGNPIDLLEVNRIALDQLRGGHRSPGRDGNHFEGLVQIDETATVRNSVVIGPTAIGSHAHVADAYIGPYTAVGAGARIAGAEIERSIVSSGATILHTGGRLAASIVGRNARVSRDFSVPRAMRLRVGDGTEVVLC